MAEHFIVFLMYHELEILGRNLCQGEPGYVRYVLSEPDFRAQIDYLKKNGWQGLSTGQALSFPAERNVCITFDDGCETDLLAAAPILLQARFNATFYITCGRLGQPGYLSAEQLRKLSGQGFEIGSHSMTHAYLTDLDDSSLRYEISESKLRLEQIIGQTVDHFSCPGGRTGERVAAVARAAGYRTVATSRTKANSEATDLFALGRVAILRNTPLSTFSAICAGTLFSVWVQSTVRDAARRCFGNDLYDRVRDTILRRSNTPR